MSAASTYRILNKLVELEVLDVKEIKTAKLYTLAENKQVDFLKSILEVDKVDYFVERASKLDGVQEILQLGKKSKNKVNLLMFGEDIDMAQVKLLVAEVKEKYDFTINQMVLSREQYEQMSQMGLYPGKKKSLFRKD